MSEVDQHLAEAERTRARMADTLDALGDRLKPSRLIESVTGGADPSRLTGEVGRFASERPWLLAVAGVALILVLSQSNRARGRSSYLLEQEEGDDYAFYGEGDAYLGDRDRSRLWGRVRQGLSSAGDTLSGAGATVLRAAGDAAHGAGDTLKRAGHSAGAAAHDVGDAASRATDAIARSARSAAHTLEEEPLALVGLGLAAGVALGLLLPDGPNEGGPALS